MRGLWKRTGSLLLAAFAVGCGDNPTQPAAHRQVEPTTAQWGVLPPQATTVPTLQPSFNLRLDNIAVAAVSVAQFANGSFETGDYTSWTLFEGPIPVPPFGTWGIATNGQTINPGESVFDFFDRINVVQTSPGLPHTYTATDGRFVSLQLQNGPQTHRMYQDIALPAGVESISWDMEYRNHFATFVPGQQEMAINIRDPQTDAILATLYRTTPGVDPLSIPMTPFERDVTAFAGQTIRFSVDHTVNNFYFDAAWDNFEVNLRVAMTKDDCMNDGWMSVVRADGSPFKNQGDCIQYVNTGK